MFEPPSGLHIAEFEQGHSGEQLAIEREAELPPQGERQLREQRALIEPLHASVFVQEVVVHALAKSRGDALVPHVRIDFLPGVW